ncbi:MAG: putative primase/helicase [Blastocatellia bacterium]|jgi:putative DNA primase/helicase|nr:putative primase/helicase [Blastocatellia bacterium]
MEEVETNTHSTGETLLAARTSLANGLSIIPVRPDGSKAAAVSWKKFQETLASEDEISQWFDSENGLAVVTGKISGGLEVLDFDEPALFKPWCEKVDERCPELLGDLPLVQTPSGGYHLYFRCEAIEGNQKLAQRQKDGGGVKTLIETRGEGGYVIAPPSPAACQTSGKCYRFVQSNFRSIPNITVAQRALLLDMARSFNEYVGAEDVITGNKVFERSFANAPKRAGDDFNDYELWEDILVPHGWECVGQKGEKEYWQRPDKNGEGASATTNFKGCDLLYVFSTNAEPFKANKAYSKFAAYTFLNHDGNFSAAAKALALDGYGEVGLVKPVTALQRVDLFNTSEALVLGAGLQRELPSVLTEAHLTDAGNAECMRELFGEKFRYCRTSKAWLVWDEQRWTIDRKGQAEVAAVRVARARQLAAGTLAESNADLDTRKRLLSWGLTSESMRKTLDTLRMAQVLSPFATTIDDFDQNPLLAATLNGTLELGTAKFRNSNPADNITLQLGASYDGQADAPLWRQFLKDVFSKDEELISYIQRAVGYCLTGETKEQAFFLCHGVGANGKSVFLDVISQMMGDYAGAASFESFDAARRSESSNDLAALKGKRLITIIEADEDRRLAEAKVKAVTGGDPISCRFLYGEYFTYRPTFKIWMAVNHRPIIRGGDRGILRRIHLIPFHQSFEGREDRHLKQKLLAESSGILNWALEGLRLYNSEGLTMPKAVSEATDHYRDEQDSIGQWLNEEAIVSSEAELAAAEGYQRYKTWAETRGEKPFAQKRWSNYLIEKEFEKARRNSGIFYKGLRINEA